MQNQLTQQQNLLKRIDEDDIPVDVTYMTKNPKFLESFSIPGAVRLPSTTTQTNHKPILDMSMANEKKLDFRHHRRKSENLVVYNAKMNRHRLKETRMKKHRTPEQVLKFKLQEEPKEIAKASSDRLSNEEPEIKVPKRSRRLFAPSSIVENKATQTDQPKNEESSRSVNKKIAEGTGGRTILDIQKASASANKPLDEELEVLKGPKTSQKRGTKTYILEFDRCKKTHVKFFSNGNKYEGELKDNRFHGKGRLSKPNGVFYEGGWKLGIKHGKCDEKMEDGTIFKGEYKDGVCVGYGNIYFPNGDHYSGYLTEGHFDNYGILNWKNGKRYEGEWKQGQFHGKGHLEYSNGDKYVGEFKEGKKEGQGTFTWANGPSYKGGWRGGKRHGSGVHTQPSGLQFWVYYKNGVRVEGKMRRGVTKLVFDRGEGSSSRRMTNGIFKDAFTLDSI